ncbi:MAG: glutamate--tRNA ligase [Bacillota bacterium]|nr:MAG: glutamate--tRNA ligase [Bacillota bacterium]
MGERVRVRYAPSPTGYLHIGGVRTILFNWLFARKHAGRFVLRFEDTDVERSRDELIQPMLDSIRWLGLDWDEGPDVGGPYGPYRQSERLHLYHQVVERLLAEGKAYHCYCTQEELAAQREAARAAGRPAVYNGRCRHLTAAERARFEREGRKPVIRLRVPDEGEIVVDDLVKGRVTFPVSQFGDPVLVRPDGMPVYNFAVVVDDHLMEITHVIRGDEHLSNTPKQLFVYQALGWEPPRFAHVPMILAPDRTKLSKRHGAVAVDEYRRQGFLPEAILNYVALLGWSPGDDREILSLDEMIELFDLDRVSHTAAIYDVEKMAWMNGHYLREADLDRVVDLTVPRLREAGLIDREPEGAERERVRAIVDAVRQRVRTLEELVEASRYFFADFDTYEEKGVRKYFDRDDSIGILEAVRERLVRVEPWTQEAIEAELRRLAEELGVGTGRVFHPTRLAVSGRTVGPGVFDVICWVGRERCLERIDRALAFIRSRRQAAGATGATRA